MGYFSPKPGFFHANFASDFLSKTSLDFLEVILLTKPVFRIFSLACDMNSGYFPPKFGLFHAHVAICFLSKTSLGFLEVVLLTKPVLLSTQILTFLHATWPTGVDS